MSHAVNITYSREVTEQEVRLTATAAAKMAELLGNADRNMQAIRIFVAGGGCGGMTYAMTFADEITEYDSAFERSGCKIVVDAVALNLLQGCEIDFANDSFIFSNVFQAVGGSGVCGGCTGGSF